MLGVSTFGGAPTGGLPSEFLPQLIDVDGIASTVAFGHSTDKEVIRAGLGAIIDAFEARIKTIHGNVGDLVFEDTPYEPRAGRAYLSCKLSAYQRSPMALDALTPNEERGYFQVNVIRPSAEGPRLARLVADRVEVTFPRGLAIPLVNKQTVTIEIASAMPSVPSGEWIVIPVLVQWFSVEPGR